MPLAELVLYARVLIMMLPLRSALYQLLSLPTLSVIPMPPPFKHVTLDITYPPILVLPFHKPMLDVPLVLLPQLESSLALLVSQENIFPYGLNVFLSQLPTPIVPTDQPLQLESSLALLVLMDSDYLPEVVLLLLHLSQIVPKLTLLTLNVPLVPQVKL